MITVTIHPKAGDVFNPATMTTNTTMSTSDVWVVRSVKKSGYAENGRVTQRAQVEVCTADYWVLTKEKDCRVYNLITKLGEERILGVAPNAAHEWKATWGMMYPMELRELPESVLDAWRRRLVQELNPYYNGRANRQLILTGMPDEPLTSLADTEDGKRPIGDAWVTEPATRNGVLQYGLACPGGCALLLAVVKTTITNPHRRAA